MTRDEFMNLVYKELHSDGDNYRANRIIGAADEYVEYSLAKQSAKPEPCEDDPREDVYYLAEKIGIHQLYALVVQLRGEPEPCEDAVSRQAAIRACGGYMVPVGIIKALPPVMPKQRTGYWYPVGMVEAVGGESAQWGSAIAYHRCSECDEQALRDDFEQEVLSDFCPHCGAKMKGVMDADTKI